MRIATRSNGMEAHRRKGCSLQGWTVLVALLSTGPVGAQHPDPNAAIFWDQSTAGVAGDHLAADLFGWSLATGDLNDDGSPDLITGNPDDDIDGKPAGTVNALLRDSDGHLIEGLLLHQENLGPDPGEIGDSFGWSVATGDFDCDGISDLAIGNPSESVGLIQNAGMVTVSYSNLSTPHLWDQNVSGVPDSAEAFDSFGELVVAADLDGDLCDDLLVSATGEEFGANPDSGVIHAFWGSAAGLIPEPDVLSIEDTPGGTLVPSTDPFGEHVAVIRRPPPSPSSRGGGSPGGFAAIYVGLPSLGDDQGLVMKFGFDGEDIVHEINSPFAEANANYGRRLAAGQMDGDEDEEILVASNDSLLILGVSTSPLYIGGSLSDFTVGDFNADGLDDIAAIVSPNILVTLMRTDAVPATFDRRDHVLAHPVEAPMLAADLNDDQADEILFRDGEGVVEIPGRPTMIFSDGFELGTTEAWSP